MKLNNPLAVSAATTLAAHDTTTITPPPSRNHCLIAVGAALAGVLLLFSTPTTAQAPSRSTLTVANTTVAESIGNVTVTITLNQGAGAGGLTFSLGDTRLGLTGEATPNADYRLPPPITIAEGETTTTATVVILNDNVVEGDETIRLGTTNTGIPGFVSGALILTITDDDTAGVVVSSPTLTVVEGSNANYTVALTSEPTHSVTLTPGSSATSAATVSGALTFTTGNWDTAQTVQVSGVATGRMATITHEAVSTDSNYSTTFTTPSVAVTVTPPPTSLTLRASTLMPAEGTTVTLTAALDNPAPGGGTPVTFMAAAGSTTTAADYTLPSLTIAAGVREGTAALVIESDSDPDDGETIILDASSSNPSLTATAITLTITDVPPGGGLDAVSRALAPELSRLLADGAIGAVARRIARATEEAEAAEAAAVGSDSPGVTVATATASATPAPGAARDGAAGTDALVHRHAPTLAALAEGQVSLAGLLNGTDFTLPLHQARSDGRTPAWLSTLTLWGGGEYRRLSNNSNGLDWQGDAVSARLGLDARVRGNWLVGVAGAFGRGTVDELGQDSDGGLQEYRLTLGSVLPYLAWTPRPGMQLWLSGGYGQGSVRLKGVGQSVRSDAAQHLVAGGGSVRLLARGSSSLHLRLEGQGVWLDIDGSAASAGTTPGGLSAHRVRTRTVRALLEGRRTVVLSGGGVLIPALSLGARHDGGDGDTGTGALVGGTVRYQGLRGLALDAGGEVLLGRGDYREWGVWGLVSWEQGAGGRGWSLRLAPRYGLGAGPGTGSAGANGFGTGNSEWLWQRGTAGTDTLATAAPASARVDLRLGYGLARGLSLLSPYGTLSLGEAARRLRLGVQWQLGKQWDLDLAGERLEQTGTDTVAPRANPEHRILLEGRLRY